VPPKAFRERSNHLRIMRRKHLQAFMSVRAVVALDKSIAIRTARWTDRHLDAKAVQQAHQGRGKLSHLTSDKARVAIQRDRFGPSLLAQGLDNSLKRGFGSEILVHLSIEEDRGAGVDGIEHLTTCCCLPSVSAGTVETSLKSSCQAVIGSGRSTGVWRRSLGMAMRPC